MVVVVVLLGVVAAAALVVAIVAHRRANEQQRRATTAEEQARLAEERAQTAHDATAVAEEQARLAEERATVLADERDQARRDADETAAVRRAVIGGVDADVLWVLEQARSERVWRHSVAIGPDSVSVFTDAADPLQEALQVELDAAREDVGAEVELDADLPPNLTPRASLLTLRTAQELLASVVRSGEVTTLHVKADGADLLVTVSSVDENDEPVTPVPLGLPRSDDVVPVEGGVRIRGAVTPGVDAANEVSEPS